MIMKAEHWLDEERSSEQEVERRVVRSKTSSKKKLNFPMWLKGIISEVENAGIVYIWVIVTIILKASFFKDNKQYEIKTTLLKHTV